MAPSGRGADAGRLESRWRLADRARHLPVAAVAAAARPQGLVRESAESVVTTLSLLLLLLLLLLLPLWISPPL